MSTKAARQESAVASPRMAKPFSYYGGKGNLVNWLLQFIPRSFSFYVEPFLGAGTLLWALQPASVETINDLDGRLMGFYQVIQRPRQFRRFRELANSTLYSRSLFDYARDTIDIEPDPVRRAWMFWVIATMSFSGRWGNSWRHEKSGSSRGMSSVVSSFLAKVDGLPRLHERLRRVQIEQRDALEVIDVYGVPGAFIYADPPYVLSTRGSDSGYAKEMSDDHHRELVDRLLTTEAMVMLSGYANPIYQRLEQANWRRIDLVTRTRVDGHRGSTPRTESIWLNYP